MHISELETLDFGLLILKGSFYILFAAFPANRIETAQGPHPIGSVPGHTYRRCFLTPNPLSRQFPIRIKYYLKSVQSYVILAHFFVLGG